MTRKEKPVGLALSGGGARGFAHLGVIQALQEHGYNIKMLSGVSAGALAAVFFAAGYKPLEILNFFLEKNYLKYFRLSIPNRGFVKNIALFKLMRDVLPERIEDLKIPTVITVTNLNEGKVEYFSEGPLARMVLASTSIPVIFQPVVYNNISYVDGGVMNNLPVEPLRGKCRHIVASHVNPFSKQDKLESILKVVERCFHLAIKENTERKKQLCTMYIEPEKLYHYKIFDFKKAPKLFDMGYEAAVKIIQEHKM